VGGDDRPLRGPLSILIPSREVLLRDPSVGKVKGFWFRRNIRRVLAASAIDSMTTGTAGYPDSLTGQERNRSGGCRRGWLLQDRVRTRNHSHYRREKDNRKHRWCSAREKS